MVLSIAQSKVLQSYVAYLIQCWKSSILSQSQQGGRGATKHGSANKIVNQQFLLCSDLWTFGPVSVIQVVLAFKMTNLFSDLCTGVYFSVSFSFKYCSFQRHVFYLFCSASFREKLKTQNNTHGLTLSVYRILPKKGTSPKKHPLSFQKGLL